MCPPTYHQVVETCGTTASLSKMAFQDMFYTSQAAASL